MTGFVDTHPDAGSGSDPVSLIEDMLDREENPAPEPVRDQKPAPEPEEDIPDPEPGPEQDPAEDGEDDEEDGEDDSQPQETATETYRVKVDGQEIEVTRDELLKGYTRYADYTRKTQDIAATRQQIEAEAQRIQQERAHYAQQLDAVASVLQSQLPPPPDPARLHSDPIGYMQDKETHEAAVTQLRGVLAERQRAQQMTQQQMQAAQAQSLEAARQQLLERLPEWKNPETAKKEQRQVADYLRTLGYQDQEIASAADPRAIEMARKAMLFDQLQASKPSVQQRVANAPKMVRPGASGPAPDKTKSIVQQLRRSGGKDLDAAARLIELG
jgi:hypothetical protein